ncbi:PREDICTED: CD151 antigen-like [Priapulus caudatus]|uniref:Tetraspanin n=1 Tax=Priapulus caudatus TaxID=37621 RepID=A0ABM1EQN8_PRICU|nr:PREDICTED: CD151 antigen-like [Priapulus caudatus]
MAKQESEGCCSVDFLKYILFIFTFFFLLAGIAVLGVGVWSVIGNERYISLLSSGALAATAYLLIVAGCLVICLTIVGCCGLIRSDRCCILVFAIFLILVFVLEAVTGILAYIYKDQLSSEIVADLRDSFGNNYMYDKDMTAAIDDLQEEWLCCGAGDPNDWRTSRWIMENKGTDGFNNLVPDSCCKTVMNTCGQNDHPSNIHSPGCVLAMENKVENNLVIVGAVALGFCALQVIGILFSCCLYRQLRKSDKYNYE